MRNAVKTPKHNFSYNPVSLDMPRSKFNRGNTLVTAFSTGDLVPVYVDPVLPGDTIRMDMAHLTRMLTPITDAFGNLEISFQWFFVPNRLVWDKWEAFCGDHEDGYWADNNTYTIPYLSAPTGGFAKNSVADYLGIPPGIKGDPVNALPFRGYALIYNTWYRSESLQNPAAVHTDSTNRIGIASPSDPIVDAELGGKLFKVCKKFDVFTSCLPAPQRGPAVDILSNVGVDNFSSDPQLIDPGELFFPIGFEFDSYGNPLKVGDPDGSYPGGADLILDSDGQSNGQSLSGSGNGKIGFALKLDSVTINDLRFAFQLQKYYEKLGRGGGRYVSYLKSMFGVTASDQRLQRPEFLGQFKQRINSMQVVQTSASESGNTPQGNVSAVSVTGGKKHVFTYSSQEHGYLFCLAFIRQDHVYQQGVERHFFDRTFTDIYNPLFANIGEVPVYKRELYYSITAGSVFGYNEAWYNYRYKPSHVTGAMRSGAGGLDIWHYADYYSSDPSLSGSWLEETDQNVARTLAVQNEPQFLVNIAFDGVWSRVMPLYSIPGLADHH